MSIIGFCIAVMLSLTVFSVVSGNAFIGGSQETSFEGITWINGSDTTMVIEQAGQSFGVSGLQGALIIITVIAVAVSLLSMRVLATGLGDIGVQTLRTSITYGGLWALLSILVINLILAIEIFGSVLYITLTFLYVYGIIKQLGATG